MLPWRTFLLLLLCFALPLESAQARGRKPASRAVAARKATAKARRPTPRPAVPSAPPKEVLAKLPPGYPIPRDVALASPVPVCGTGFGQPGVTLPEAKGVYRRMAPALTRGSAQIVEMVGVATRAVRAAHPEADPVVIGRFNQPLKRRVPWLMHQDGLDADLGIFRVGGLQDGFGPGLRPEAFDAPRTWSLVRTLLATHRVEWILLDQPLIDALAAHARRAEGWTQAQLATVFPAPGAPRLWERAGYLRHTAGHANHVHVHAVCSGPTSR